MLHDNVTVEALWQLAKLTKHLLETVKLFLTWQITKQKQICRLFKTILAVAEACTSCAAAPCCSCLPLSAQRRWRKACVQQSSAAEQEKRLLRFWSRSV